MSAPDTYLQLREQIDDVRQRWKGRSVLTGCMLAAACTLALLVVLVTADNVLKPSGAGRFVLSALFYGGLVASLLHFILRRVRDNRRDEFFGALVEQRHTALRNHLISALQLGRGDAYGSPQVVDAIVDDALHATADVDVSDCLDSREMKWAGSVAGLAAAITFAYALALTPWFSNGVSRVLLPASVIGPYTATQIAAVAVEPGEQVPEGTRLDFTARTKGRAPSRVALARKTPVTDSWSLKPMTEDPQGQGTYTCSIPQVRHSFEYRVYAGDAKSGVSRVEVVPRPRVERIALTCQPPAYTGLAASVTEKSDGTIAGLPGTTVRIDVTATKALRQAHVVMAEKGGGKVPLAAGQEKTQWGGEFVLLDGAEDSEKPQAARAIAAPNRYQIRLEDTTGYEDAEPVWRSVSLVRDQSPGVSIVAPGRDVHAQAKDTLRLVVDARDDYGLGSVEVLFRVNDDTQVRPLARFDNDGEPSRQARHEYEWNLGQSGLKPGDLVRYWAVASDRNDVTGPGTKESRRFSIFILTPAVAVAQLEIQMNDFVQVLDELLRLQRENRAKTASGIPFEDLVTRQNLIRKTSQSLARAMEGSPTSLESMVETLDRLYVGPMADVVRLLEEGRDTRDALKAGQAREESLPIQDQIVEELKALLARLQRNEQARNRLRKIAKTDEPSYEQISDVLARMMEDLGRMAADTDEFMGKFEKLPKKDADEVSGEALEKIEALDELTRKWGEWAKGSVDELTKLPTGFVDDFGLRPELERIYEEIEEVAQKPETVKMHVALEDLGAGLATEMLEDLEMWMLDAPDNLQWVMEEPLLDKPMEIPEMPLPDVLQDMVGDLLEEANEIDQEAEDVTSAWGDSLNQAGWGVMDGPISNYSAKGVTGNVLPNDIELGGRAGDGRRGKSSGQMVSETTRNLEGRQTPARVSAERYEPGAIKAEQSQDPGGATGGGKKAGAGRQGLQGGTPPDFVKDMDRLRNLHVGLREHATRVANQLELAGVQSRRLDSGIELMKSLEDDLRDLRYQDAARRRRTALSELRAVPRELEQSLAVELSQARELPPNLREDLLQGADEAYPEGYESLLSNYYRALARAEGE